MGEWVIDKKKKKNATRDKKMCDGKKKILKEKTLWQKKLCDKKSYDKKMWQKKIVKKKIGFFFFEFDKKQIFKKR